MNGLSLTFQSPWFLALLFVVPLFWWIGRKSLAGLGLPRAMIAVGLRTAIAIILVLALAETQSRQASRAVSVVYLLDQSLSIPALEREGMYQYVAREVEAHRNAGRGDRAGVIAFGREAVMEVPLIGDDLAWLRHSESLVPRMAEATNLADAAKLALSTFSNHGARRVVIVTDGNENLGAVRQIAPQFAEQGIGIDVVPIRLTQPNDVAVEKVDLPVMAQPGQTIEARVVIANDVTEASGNSTGGVSGRLRVTRHAGAATELLAEQDVELVPGKNVFPVVHRLDAPPGFYTYEAHFLPHDVTAERTRENNRATASLRLASSLTCQSPARARRRERPWHS